MADLESEVAAGAIQVQQLRDGIRVNVAQEILFPSGSATLSGQGKEVLRKVSDQLQDSEYQIAVAGYTDNTPISGNLARRYPSNWELSVARAASVAHVLFGEDLISQERVHLEGYADTQPIDTNDSEEGKARNRRVEIALVYGEDILYEQDDIPGTGSVLHEELPAQGGSQE